jgi:hypothetical protein
MTLLTDLVSASQEVAATRSRSRKVAILAELLRKLDPNEVPIAVGFLSGVPRQGRVGVGYSTIYGIEREPAGEASLTVDDLDRSPRFRRRRAADRRPDGRRSSASFSGARRSRRPTSSSAFSPASCGKALWPG